MIMRPDWIDTPAPDEEAGDARWRTANDATLALTAGLTDAAEVWRELVRRFEPVIRHQLARTLGMCRKLLSSDSVDEALAEYWLALLKDNRVWLLRFDPFEGASLATWLCTLARDVGAKHLRMLRKRAQGRPETDPDDDPSRGGTFLGRERAVVVDDDESALLALGGV